MSGTKAGGQKTAQYLFEEYGPDYFRKIGRLGGLQGRTGGFASLKVGADGLNGKERASRVGSIGGKKSRKPEVNWTLGLTFRPTLRHSLSKK